MRGRAATASTCDGKLEERTADWYSQDRRGNVWYFGEATAELDAHGRVTTTEGSWQAGRGGAKAGIYMPARPVPGRFGRQEFYKGQADDHFRVLSARAAVRVPYTSSHSALLTKEWTPLEPGVVDHKHYVRGIGTVLEQTVKGGDERQGTRLREAPLGGGRDRDANTHPTRLKASTATATPTARHGSRARSASGRSARIVCG